MSNDVYVIYVNQITTGPTGHVNATYAGPGYSTVTYGANVSPGSGVQIEDNSGRTIAQSTAVYVSKENFERSLNFARAADVLNGSYFGLCNNCVDFVNEALSYAGLGQWSVKNYLADGTLTDTYAKAAEYICGNEYVSVAASNILNILGTASNVQDAVEFVSSMSWLADHPTNSDFYSQYLDPDLEADIQLARLKHFAKKLGITVDYDPIEEKVTLGVASPIVIDMNGDGIKTLAYSAHSVNFDIDSDGIKDKTAWLSSEDGFLAVDKNGNGSVDGVGELFGGILRGDGYSKLADFDSNQDGFVTKDDVGYSMLSIWRDSNMNGVTDSGELVSAMSAGLESISTAYLSQDEFQNNNLIGEVSKAIVFGQEVQAADVYFRYKSGAFDEVAVENQVVALISAMSGYAPEAAAHSTFQAPPAVSDSLAITYPG